MNRYIVLGGAAFTLFAFFLPGVFGLVTLLGPPSGSIASGNVYDVYSINVATGASQLVAHCVSYATYLSYQNTATTNYSAGPNPSCGPIVLVTSTTVSGTTFTNASPGCPPNLPAGYSCASSTATFTVTTTATQTSTITTTVNGTPTTITTTQTQVVTTTLGGSGGGSFSLNLGEILGVLVATLGFVVKQRKNA